MKRKIKLGKPFRALGRLLENVGFWLLTHGPFAFNVPGTHTGGHKSAFGKPFSALGRLLENVGFWLLTHGPFAFNVHGIPAGGHQSTASGDDFMDDDWNEPNGYTIGPYGYGFYVNGFLIDD